MRQKMSCSALRSLARNSIAATRPRFDFIYTKNFQISRCDRKWRFSKRETAFAGVQKIFRSHFIYTKNFQGGRCDRKSRFSKGETAFAGQQNFFRSHFIYTKNFQGGDATENRDFQREKQRLQGSKFFSDLILSKERIFFLEQGRGLF